MLRKLNKEQAPFTDSCSCSKPRGKIHGDKHRSSSATIRGMVVPPKGQWRIQLRFCTAIPKICECGYGGLIPVIITKHRITARRILHNRKHCALHLACSRNNAGNRAIRNGRVSDCEEQTSLPVLSKSVSNVFE
jgi:hypothetical protein